MLDVGHDGGWDGEKVGFSYVGRWFMSFCLGGGAGEFSDLSSDR